MGICHTIIAILFGINQYQWATHKAAGWAAVTMVWLFVVNFGYSWGPCGWVIISEVWPLSNRAYGIALGASSNWMSNFIVGQITPIMLQKITFGTFIFFGILTFGGGAFIWLFVPETKRLTLEEMDVLFGSTGVAEVVSLTPVLSFSLPYLSLPYTTPVGPLLPSHTIDLHSLILATRRTPAAWPKSTRKSASKTSCRVWAWAWAGLTRAARTRAPARMRRMAVSIASAGLKRSRTRRRLWRT